MNDYLAKALIYQGFARGARIIANPLPERICRSTLLLTATD
jgi:hypothetical protein